MSTMVGAPPQTMGDPASASWWRTMPARVSAACWTMDPMSVTGDATPASGMEMSSAGTRARARSMTLRHANSDQVRGGDGQTSNTARGLLRQRVASAGVDRQQVDHDRRPARRERPGHHRLGRVHEAQEQPVQVPDLGRDVVGDDGRGDRVVGRQGIGDADDPGEVRGLRPARVQGLGIQHLHAGRSRVEVDDALPVARRRVAGPVEQAELVGDRVQRPPDHRLGDGDPLAVGAGAVRDEQGDRLGLLHLDAGPLQQLQGLVHDAVDEAGVEELETGSHGRVSGRWAGGSGGLW